MSDFMAHLVLLLIFSFITAFVYVVFGFEITVLMWLVVIAINIMNNDKE